LKWDGHHAFAASASGVGAVGQEAGTGKYGRDQGEADLAPPKERREEERSVGSEVSR
jgi:hypothetical protein